VPLLPQIHNNDEELYFGEEYYNELEEESIDI